jgi:hypothetical protein
MCACAPEMAREVTGEEQSVVAAVASEKRQGRFSAKPDRVDVFLKPEAKLESVELGLIE